MKKRYINIASGYGKTMTYTLSYGLREEILLKYTEEVTSVYGEHAVSYSNVKCPRCKSDVHTLYFIADGHQETYHYMSTLCASCSVKAEEHFINTLKEEDLLLWISHRWLWDNITPAPTTADLYQARLRAYLGYQPRRRIVSLEALRRESEALRWL